MIRIAIFISALLVSSLSYAVVQEHTFYITGDNGESGTGTFTWDDTSPPDGNGLSVSQMLTLSISISGGNVIASPANFVKADCTGGPGGGFADDTPDFTFDINFWCDNGTNSLEGVEEFTNVLNGGPSTLTFSNTLPVPAPIPTMSVWGLGILAGLLGLMGFVRRRKA